MSIDISNLSVPELDQLISRAAKRREELNSPMPDAQPQGELRAVLDPKWYVSMVEAGTLLQIRDPGHHWLNYVIPPASRVVLLTHMLQHALFPKVENLNAPVISAPSGGGGRLH